VNAVEEIRAGKTPESATDFAHALGATVCDEELEPAYRAEVLNLPSESDIAREIGKDVDPDAIHQAREALRADVGRTLHAALSDLYETHAPRGPYSPDAKSTGKRALRNRALALLAETGEAGETGRVADHYKNAQNMTDTIAALSILAHLDDAAREAAFDDFYKRWKDDHLVIDKWFMLQATSSLPSAIDRIGELAEHELFSLQNPNKVRALIGAFANMNPVNFNRADGKGYAFVADKMLEIDRFNPQIAARLLGSFKSWRLLESGRRARAKEVLERVANAPGLSRDSYEIVSKTLE
jgi:aminopeptidase N